MTAAEKILSPEELERRLPRLHRPIVFTNGCFDIVHRGHVDYLERAAALGETLIVAVNSDSSVRKLKKGGGRPFNPLEDRLAVLAALASVSYVVPLEDDTPLALVKLVRPEHLVKGGDWSVKTIVGAEEVRSYGGKVHSLPFRFNRSTTELFARIRQHG